MAVADTGGVTRAAGVLNLTQSAVSMQLKRLEDSLNLSLIDRSGRTVGLTAEGEQLLGYARRMLALNDEALRKLTSEDLEGELRLGVPHDIIYPRVPKILKDFAVEFPRMRVRLISAPSRRLKEMFSRGEVDVILTTEAEADLGGEILLRLPLEWVGAISGTAWKERPLRIAFCSNCNFRPGVLRILNATELAWEMAVDSDLDNAVEAAVSADLAVTASISGTLPPQTEVINHNGALPDLGDTGIILYAQISESPAIKALTEIIRAAHQMKDPAEFVRLTA